MDPNTPRMIVPTLMTPVVDGAGRSAHRTRPVGASIFGGAVYDSDVGIARRATTPTVVPEGQPVVRPMVAMSQGQPPFIPGRVRVGGSIPIADENKDYATIFTGDRPFRGQYGASIFGGGVSGMGDAALGAVSRGVAMAVTHAAKQQRPARAFAPIGPPLVHALVRRGGRLSGLGATVALTTGKAAQDPFGPSAPVPVPVRPPAPVPVAIPQPAPLPQVVIAPKPTLSPGATSALVTAPATGSRTMLIVGALVGLGAIAGVVYLVQKKKKGGGAPATT
jgi:hypothetical protein